MEPMGDIQQIYMLAILCSVLVNSLRSIFAGKNEKPKPISPESFIPNWAGDDWEEMSPEERSEQSLEEMKDVFKQLAATSNNPPKAVKPKTKKRIV